MKKINFQDLPNTDTPIKASTLNQMQSNIEESCVAVSPTQPETNEKVWIQKGKNLISPSNIFKGYAIDENTTDLTVYGNGLTTGWIQVLSNTTYTLSGGNRCRFQFKNDNGVVTYGGANLTNPYSFTTLADTKYVRIYFYDYYNAPITYPELPKVQLEQGSTATEYEAYVEPKILCKNDNGVFEKVYKGNPIIYVGKITTEVKQKFAESSQIEAVIPDGYTFVCWLLSSTQGWISSTYIQDGKSSTTKLWVSGTEDNVEGSYGNVDCTYLCVKNIEI